MKRTALLALALLATLPARAQEAPRSAAEEARTREAYPVAAAAWCAVRSENEEPAALEAEPDPAADPAAADDPGAPGCDIGIGAAVYRWRRASLVAVLGAETVGAGIAWTAYRPERGPILAFALGVVARYDSRGIDGSEFYPAVGATLSFTGRRE